MCICTQPQKQRSHSASQPNVTSYSLCTSLLRLLTSEMNCSYCLPRAKINLPPLSSRLPAGNSTSHNAVVNCKMRVVCVENRTLNS